MTIFCNSHTVIARKKSPRTYYSLPSKLVRQTFELSSYRRSPFPILQNLADVLYFNAIADLDPESYSLEFPDEGSRLVFKGKSKGFNGANATEYEMDVELFDKVLPDKVQKSLTGKSLYVVLPKKGKFTLFGTSLVRFVDSGSSNYRTQARILATSNKGQEEDTLHQDRLR